MAPADAAGIATNDPKEFFSKDIRALEVNQSFWGRLIGVGDLTIATADLVAVIPQPKRVRDLIIAQRQRHSAYIAGRFIWKVATHAGKRIATFGKGFFARQ